MCRRPGHTHSAYIQYKQQHNSWELKLPSDTLSSSSAHGQQTLRSAGRDHFPSASDGPAAKAGLCHSAQLSPEGRSCPDKESWTSLPCAWVLVSGNFTFPSRVSGSTLTALSDVKLSQAGTYVWDDPRHFFPCLSCWFQNRFLTALESNFFVVHDLHFRGST